MTRLLSALAALALVTAVLVQPDRPGPLAPLAFLPLELPLLLVLLIAAPPRLRGPLRTLLTVLLTAMAVLKLADLGVQVAYLRPFNPMLDGELVPAAWRLGSGAVGTPIALAAAAALFATLALLAAALWWATGRLARLAPSHPRWLGALALPLAALVVLGARPDPPLPLEADTSRIAWEHARDAWTARADLATFRAEAAGDPFAALPPEAILPALRGTDVFVIFVESYGRSAFTNPLYAPTVTAALHDGETALAAKGLAMRSAWLTAPMVGGQSWLAHASILSGLWIDNQGRYRALLASPRRTLLHLAHAAGWQTAAVMPAITLAWPEAGYFGYDRILAAADLGYRGLPFNWVTMPDQFTLASFQRQLLDPAPRAPVFAEIALISSHAPWTPIPPLLPWDAIGDGTVFDRYATAGDPPDVVWRDNDRVREQYRQSLDYTLRVVTGFAARLAAHPPLFVVLGDHQPAAFVSGDPVSHDVPVHLIGSPATLAHLDAWGFTPGLVPAPDAPVWGMDAFRDRFLQAFGTSPPLRAAAAPQAAPSRPLSRPLEPGALYGCPPAATFVAGKAGQGPGGGTACSALR